jgi:hypothetical protein
MALSSRVHRPFAGGNPVKSRRAVWLAVFLGIFLVCAAWATVAPYDGTPDETEHAINAYAVADGQVFKSPADAGRGTGTFVNAPASLTHRGDCFHSSPAVTPNCAVGPVGSQQVAPNESVVGRYNPIYYALVGIPLRLDPSWGGLMAARLMTAAIVAAMLTWALYAAVRWSRSRVMVAGILVAMTPTVFELAGSVNPNALEISAGIALFAGLIPLADPDRAPTKGMVALVGVSALQLALLRALGPLWLVAAVFVLFVPSSRARLAELWRLASVRWWLGGALLACLAGGIWTLAFKTLGVAIIEQPHMSRLTIVKNAILLPTGGWEGLAREMVGAMGWREYQLPGIILFGWYGAFGLLVLAGMFFGTWVDRWRIFAILAAAFGVATLATITTAQKFGFEWQGRYILPMAAGAPLYAAWVLTKRDVISTQRVRPLIRGLALLLLPLGLAALWHSQVRWEFGFRNPATLHLNPFSPAPWEPRFGPELPMVCAVLGFAVLGWFAWYVTRSGSLAEDGPDAGTAAVGEEGTLALDRPAPRPEVAARNGFAAADRS